MPDHFSVAHKTVAPHPTVLVASDSGEMRRLLVDGLRQDNCHVLEADSMASTLDVVRGHSRPIHVLLLDVNLGALDPAVGTLRSYRSGMEIMSIGCDKQPGVLLPLDALASTCELLKAHTKRGAAGAG